MIATTTELQNKFVDLRTIFRPAALLPTIVLLGLLAGCGGTPRTTTSVVAAPKGPELAWLKNPAAPLIDGETMAAWGAVRTFYGRGEPRLAWTAADASALLGVLRNAGSEGLNPPDYHLTAIERHVDTLTPSSVQRGELDLLLTDAALRYAHDQQMGRFTPQQMDPEWFIASTPQADSATALHAALDNHRLPQWLAELPPAHPGYAELRRTLARFQTLTAQGGWPSIESGPKLIPGKRDPRVVQLRRRLEITGELETADVNDASLYDASLAEAVRIFQSQHGQEPDGIVGASTLQALNVTAPQRVRQLQVNMERWRWLPRQFESHYIIVNMAGFNLQLMENDAPILEMRVIVGRQLRSTPVFNSHLTYIVFNPYWNVPQSIAAKDLLPKLRAKPDFAQEQNIDVFNSWSADAQPIDPQTIDWSKYSEKYFPFRLRQRPGPGNSLGQLKFLLPNAYDIYLHDTPTRTLFNKAVRAFSSGCIRLQKPYELAEYLLRGAPKWSSATINEAVASQHPQTVKLPRPEPLYLVYFTAWVDAAGAIQFRDDIYERDARLEQAFGNVH